MELRRTSLSPTKRILVDRAHEVQFGRIENLMIINGEPHFGTETRLIRTITFTGADNRSKSRVADDFPLKRPWIELFDHFALIGDGLIEKIDLKAGMPCFMSVEEPAP
jgi:hypothetical protein